MTRVDNVNYTRMQGKGVSFDQSIEAYSVNERVNNILKKKVLMDFSLRKWCGKESIEDLLEEALS